MEILALFLSAAVLILLVVLFIKINSKDDSSKLNSLSKDMTVISTRLDDLSKNNAMLYQTVDRRLETIRADNEKQLSQIRQTVDEKLEKTIESRLTTSFKTVSTQLEAVYKQLGEMQTLSKDVGNLERVLTNVKTRGMWGELQAEKILQEILLPEQYLKNTPTKKGSHDPVEFAVKLPGTTEDSFVLLPIDSKFPREDYERLCEASECNDSDAVKASKVALERRIISEAKDIKEKYIDCPNTTDFAVLFLPIEGLYAEVLSVSGLQERLQREFHVMVAGPATLASLLNSLQMGFRTLAIEKKSAEVWNILGQVKTEFGKFSVTLEKVQEKLSSASREVENVFVRQRVLDRKLKSVEAVEIESSKPNLVESDDIV